MMNESVRIRRNHTLLCLMAVYGIHGVLFHVLSSPPVLITKVIVKPACLRSISKNNRTSSNTNFYSQSFPDLNKTMNNVSTHLPVTYRKTIIGMNVDACILNKSNTSSNEISHKENLLLKRREHLYKVSSQTADDLLNSTSSSTASGTLSVMAFLFSDEKILKILSPSAWGSLIGCLVFLFTSTDYEIE